MERVDVLIASILVLALVASGIGVATYEDDRLAEFVVTWTTRDAEASFEPASLAGGGDAESVLNVAMQNLTRAVVTVTLTGQAARVAPTSWRVELVVPGVAEPVAQEGSLPAGPGASVAVPLEVALAEVPSQESTRAPSADAALATLTDAFGTSVGVGEWVLRVSVASGAPGPLAETVSASAEATLTAYEAQVAARLPEVGR